MVTRALAEITGDGFVFRVDFRLRPEGQKRRHLQLAGRGRELLRELRSDLGTPGPAARAPRPRAIPGLGAAFSRPSSPSCFRASSGPRTLDEVRSLRQQFVDAPGIQAGT